MEQYRYWLALKQIPGVGNLLFKRLIECFKDPQRVFEASPAELCKIEGISGKISKDILSFDEMDLVDRTLEQVDRSGVSLLTLNDENYPALLSTIYDPPPILYIKGRWPETLNFPLAVVGSRKTSAYGRTVTERLCGDLVRLGATIVSGFARGIDAIAHKTVIDRGGVTLAVLGCGVDRIYPPEHKKLYAAIQEKGALISEFPMGESPSAFHFPQRNRIISGLSLGSLVIEAGLKSGSLITARLASEQNREVFAVPGPIFSDTSAGPHQLINTGAKLVQSVDDILEELQNYRTTQAHTEALPVGPVMPDLPKEEAEVYASLSLEPKHIDRVIRENNKSPSCISTVLLTLELKDLVRQMSGQYYVKVESSSAMQE